MTDTRKRKTLKMMASTTAAIAGSAIYPLLAKKGVTHPDISIQHNPFFDANYLVLNNPTGEALTVDFASGQYLDSPAGRVSLESLSSKGSINLPPRGSKVIELNELEKIVVKERNMNDSIGHFALRYPVRDNVIIDHVALTSNNSVLSKQTPVYLTRTRQQA